MYFGGVRKKISINGIYTMGKILRSNNNTIKKIT
jgi:hypothetical protein